LLFVISDKLCFILERMSQNEIPNQLAKQFFKKFFYFNLPLTDLADKKLENLAGFC